MTRKEGLVLGLWRKGSMKPTLSPTMMREGGQGRDKRREGEEKGPRNTAEAVTSMCKGWTRDWGDGGADKDGEFLEVSHQVRWPRHESIHQDADIVSERPCCCECLKLHTAN